MNTFNVEEFNNLIENIITVTNRADVALKKISSCIEEMKSCINNQENAYLYQGWNSVKLEVDNISTKFYERKEEFLSNLVNYKNSTLIANDRVYQDVQRALDYLNTISTRLGSL